MGRPLSVSISIIIPNLNRKKFLDKSIQSFLEQDYANKELIIVDGKSTDGSHDIIKRFANKHKEIIWITEPDSGIGNAYNLGIKRATSEIIGYLGADDLLYKDIFKEINEANSWCPFDAIYFNSYTWYINDGQCLFRRCSGVPFTKENLLKDGTLVGLQNIFFRRNIFSKYLFDEQNKYCQDYEFYLRIASEKYLYLYVDEVASINIFDGNNITGSKNHAQVVESCDVAARYVDQFGYVGPICFDVSKRTVASLYLSGMASDPPS